MEYSLNKKLRIMMIGAHPDDCDVSCGATAILFQKNGHDVKFVSFTDGSAGHYQYKRAETAKIRKSEAASVASLTGIQYQVMDYADGELEVNIETRTKMLSIIREFNPDIIITHRPNDYHPDHRYTSQLVLDASYLVMVPNVCPQTLFLKHQPVILYMCDSFEKPNKFTPDIVVGIDAVFEQKLKMVSCHKSQFDEWLPWIDKLQGTLQDNGNCSYAFSYLISSDSQTAARYRDNLISKYGKETGNAFHYAEAYEISELGGQISKDDINGCFSF
jgi:LmbE family N-acetylglucosaminyl deacetylase